MNAPPSAPALRTRSVRAVRRARSAPPPRLPYTVLIAYADVPAARHAIARLQQTVRVQRPDCELFPMLWRFEQLEHPRWRTMALRDAARANTLVLALGTRGTLTPGVDAWLNALAAENRGATTSALALLGDEPWTISLQRLARARQAPAAAIDIAAVAACAA